MIFSEILPPPPHIIAIIAHLTEAQRRWIGTATMDWSSGGLLRACPPANTHKVLMRAGLMNTDGTLTGDGQDVRSVLKFGIVKNDD